MVAASHDGGPDVRAGRDGRNPHDRRRRLGPPLAADGDNVFVAFVDNKDRVWTAGSRDGGRTFPCMAQITVPGDYHGVDGGGDYDLAVDGDTVYWTWLTTGSTSGSPLDRRRPDDRAGRRDLRNPEYWNYPGVPRIAADDGVAAIVVQQGVPDAAREPHGHGLRLGARGPDDRRPRRDLDHEDIGGEGSRCVGDYCAAPYRIDVDDGRVYVAWRAKGTMWLARSEQSRRRLRGPNVIGPYIYGGSHHPSLAARGENVVATWYTGVRPGSWDIDVVGAFSSDHGQSFAMTTVARRAARPVPGRRPPGAPIRPARASPGGRGTTTTTAATPT